MTSYMKSVLSMVSSALELNAATFSGAIDIIVFQDEKGGLQCTPFHARFGKLRLLKSLEKVVQVEVNGELHPEIQMRLGSAGEAYFIEETDEKPPEDLCPSPASMPSSPKMSAYDQPDIGSMESKSIDVQENSESNNLKDAEALAVTYLSDSEVDHYKKLGTARRRSMRADSTTKSSLEPMAEQASTPTPENGIGGATPSTEDLSPSKWDKETQESYEIARAVTEVLESILTTVILETTPNLPTSIKRMLHTEKSKEKNNTPGSELPCMEDLKLPPSILSVQKPTDLTTTANGAMMQSFESADNDYEESTISADAKSTSSDALTNRKLVVVSHPIGSESSPVLENGTSPQSEATTSPSEYKQKKASLVPNNVHHENFAPGVRPGTPDATTDVEFEEPQLLSMSLCGHLVSPDMDENEVAEIFEKNRVTYNSFAQNPNLLNDPKMLMRMGDRLLHWEIAAPVLVSMLSFGVPLDIDRLEKAIAKKETENRKETNSTSSISRLFGFTRRKKPSEEGIVCKEPILGNVHALPAPPMILTTKKHIRKSLRPPEEMLKKLKLKPGCNKICFKVYSSLQGQQEVTSSIYLWSTDQKIVVSDVDGTITKSDVLGQLLPRMGRDWSHSGVVELFHELVGMGYNLMYLTSRPIGQAGSTRAYLKGLVQGELGLPQGPLLMSPDRLIRSITREVILRRPQEFKIQALRDVRMLFPPDYNPFYAGFGNRESDVISYCAVGIPPQRIFTINPKGQLNIMNAMYEACGNYSDLNKFVRSVFPDIKGFHGQKKITELLEAPDYNDFTYWKPSLPEVNIKDLLG